MSGTLECSMSDATLKCDWCEEAADEVCSACGRCPACQTWECALCVTEADRTVAAPLPTIPRFAVGDAVWAYNGEPRIVTGMRWVQGRAGRGERQRWMPWGWALDTVHPDDPACKGCGWEFMYRARSATSEGQRDG